ncbi:Sodium/calcium exchanger protein-domain-containing protein [Crucibulum laeve]|uniref:Sodium/calcium exchanger protein-domain-containing protein n=1 Tax=Crucibulum laeve TaxID=68775 RepID=A0A5C3MGL9_9AGAR|nr:Sodium/calcium exchanger protein-domain-containing protein [Crucibulum laeve]
MVDSSSETATTLISDHNARKQSTPTNGNAYPPPRPTKRRTGTGTSESRGSSGRFRLFRAATTMAKPEKRVGPAPSAWKSIRAIICASWLNVLLVCIPVSWALHFALKESSNKDTLVFVFSFIAIIPLAKLLAFATEELSLRVGQTLGGLLNATLGNAVELIVAIIALVKCELRVVQASLVGSILSNLLLVLGMCFFAGGVKYSEQGFGVSSTQLNSSLLTISVIAVLLPAAFHFSADAQLDDQTEGRDILLVSHGVAIILLFIYGGYLFFQLYSHTALYQDKGEHVIQSTKYTKREKKGKTTKVPQEKAESALVATGSSNNQDGLNGNTPTAHDPEAVSVSTDGEEEEETPQMSVAFTIGLLCVVTVFVAITAEWLVDSIDGLTDQGGISKEFVGIILLPIVGNAAEHVTAVTVSVKDKLTLSLGVAVGSSIQIALFVIPFIVVLGWILGKPLTLLFDPYESIALFLSVLTVNYVVQDGKSNWLEGFILMCLYIILAVTFWFYPGSDPSGLLAKCT